MDMQNKRLNFIRKSKFLKDPYIKGTQGNPKKWFFFPLNLLVKYVRMLKFPKWSYKYISRSLELNEERANKIRENFLLLTKARIQFKLTKETQEKLLKVLNELIAGFEAANKEANQIMSYWKDKRSNMGRMKIEFSIGKKMFDSTMKNKKMARENIIFVLTSSFTYWERVVLNKNPELCNWKICIFHLLCLKK